MHENPEGANELPDPAVEEPRMTREGMRQYLLSVYSDYLQWVTRLIGNEEDARDVVQDAIVKLLLACERVEQSRVRQFCFTALRNCVYDYWRTMQRRQKLARNSAGKAPPQPQEDVLELVVNQLEQAYRALPPRQREVFAAYWRGCGERGAALSALGCDPKSPSCEYDRHLCAARKAIRSALAPLQGAQDKIDAARLWERISRIITDNSNR